MNFNDYYTALVVQNQVTCKFQSGLNILKHNQMQAQGEEYICTCVLYQNNETRAMVFSYRSLELGRIFSSDGFGIFHDIRHQTVS